MISILLVGLGGGAGAALRFVVGTLLTRRWPSTLPLSTALINISGSWALGLVGAAVTGGVLGAPWAAAWSVGVCGGYTTFSTAMVDTVRLIRGGRPLAGLGVLLASTVACVAAAGLGLWLGRVLWP